MYFIAFWGKYGTWYLKIKLKILGKVKSEILKEHIAEMYGINSSSLSTIIKKEDKLKQQEYKYILNSIKWVWTVTYVNLEEASFNK